jgi:hypothetical protein
MWEVVEDGEVSEWQVTHAQVASRVEGAGGPAERCAASDPRMRRGCARHARCGRGGRAGGARHVSRAARAAHSTQCVTGAATHGARGVDARKCDKGGRVALRHGGAHRALRRAGASGAAAHEARGVEAR